MHHLVPSLAVGFLCGVVISCTGRVPAPCTECDGVCVDKKVDSANCGECGRKCPGGTVCSAGECVVSCPDAQRACSGGCFDLSVDPRHCGGCGNACATSCVDGGCLPARPCGPLPECGGRCVDTSSDPSNCGRCGVSCDGGFCRNGTCALCTGGNLAECGGRCVDTSVDPSNCGGCGVSCDGGFCRTSTCALCSGGNLAECGGRCVDTSVDPSNCGACGVSCDGGFCRNASCALCTGSLATCGGRCVDTVVDPSNCGGCGTTCDGGYCVGGTCNALCAPGTTPCNGRCAATDTEVANCGGCGVTCPSAPNATASCTMASCSLVCAPGRFDCDGLAANGCESFAGCVVPISILANGAFANDFPVVGASNSVGILNGFDVSADGRRVAFVTASNGIVADDVNGRADYFVKDMTTGLVRSLTHTVQGGQPIVPEIVMSANGEVVLFTSPLDLTGQGADGAVFVYAWRVSNGRFTRVVDSNTHDEHDLDISDDGARIVFISSMFGPAAPSQRYRGWLLESDGGSSVIFDPSPVRPWALDAGCNFVGSGQTKISGDGQLASISTNAQLIAEDTNTAFDVFVRPLDGGRIEIASRQSDGGLTVTSACTASGNGTDLNGDGTVVTFYGSERLTPNTPNVFSVFARRDPTTLLISREISVVPSAFPSVDRSGLRFTYVDVACVLAETSGATVTRTTLARDCRRARLSAGGRAVAFLAADLLVPDAGADGGLNLYLKYLP